jgi:type VI secretion system secreted protein VgrG
VIALSDLAALPGIDALFGVKLSQHARLITIATSQDSALPQALVAERFIGREAVNELFDFEIDALSTSTDLDLAAFIGEEITLGLLQPDGARRSWHGLCVDAEWLGADGGLARYRLHLQPALALLGLRRDSYIFQDKDARDLITELLADYPQVVFELDVSQQLAVRPIWTQYRESDLEFLQRVLAAEGLSWRFEHDQGEDSEQQHSRHKVVFFDSAAALPATPGGEVLRFHGVRATDVDDAIDSFAARRQVAANAVTLSKANEKIVLQTGQSSVTLEGGNITFACPGTFSVKGSQHKFHAGHRDERQLTRLPDAGLGIIPASALKWLYDEQIEFRNYNNALLANIGYHLKLEDGTVVNGVTDSEGKTRRISSIRPLAIVHAQLQHNGHTSCCNSNSSEDSHTSIIVNTASVTLNRKNVGTSVIALKTEEGDSRGLTEGEIAEARKIFFDSIDYAKVRVHNGEYLWFGLQPDDTAMTPNGEIFFNPKHFVEDFSKQEQEELIWFIHEMVHVWQHQLGFPVKWRGAIRLGLDYRYTLEGSKTLADFNMEAQGNVLADFWALKRYLPRPRAFNERKHINDLSLYEKVLKRFIDNPSDPSNLPDR